MPQIHKKEVLVPVNFQGFSLHLILLLQPKVNLLVAAIKTGMKKARQNDLKVKKVRLHSSRLAKKQH